MNFHDWRLKTRVIQWRIRVHTWVVVLSRKTIGFWGVATRFPKRGGGGGAGSLRDRPNPLATRMRNPKIPTVVVQKPCGIYRQPPMTHGDSSRVLMRDTRSSDLV